MANPNTAEQSTPFANEERLVSRRLIRKLVPVSDMTIWRWERDNSFPRHLTIHGRNYWLYTEVEEWMAKQRRGHLPNTSSDD